jgi:catechol 2,3-dioxygenase-like lactoylglutathione lyase family enzyme
MLGQAQAIATVAVKDLEQSKKFYEGKLGLEAQLAMDGWVQYECGKGTALSIYQSNFAGTNEATSVTLAVEDVEAEMKQLRDKGVEFEDYDLPGLKTENGVAQGEEGKAAWFKDPDGNILALVEM